jgi:hypothetical protein
LCAGTYTVSVTDALSCSPATTMAITVSASTSTLSVTPTFTNVSCFGACDGIASVNVSGGTAPYNYNWLPSGGNSATANGLCPGTYTCNATDATGCPGTATITITEPVQLSATSSATPAACGNNNGSASVTPSGGTPVYSYSWAPVGGNAATASNLVTGNYTCTITDANGCTLTHTVTVPATGGLSSSIAGTDPLCYGGTGSATITPVAGNPGFTYAWSPSGGNAASASGLVPGTNYSCTVTDATGCTSTSTITLLDLMSLATEAATDNWCHYLLEAQLTILSCGVADVQRHPATTSVRAATP